MHLIKELALYEKAPEKVLADEKLLQRTLFGEKRYAEVVLATDGPAEDGEAIGLALFVRSLILYYGSCAIEGKIISVSPVSQLFHLAWKARYLP